MLRLGDKVTIISKSTYDLLKDEKGNFGDFTEPMSEYCGKEAIIKDITIDGCLEFPMMYILDIDSGVFDWRSYMFCNDRNIISNIYNSVNKSIENYCNNICIINCDKKCPLNEIKKKRY